MITRKTETNPEDKKKESWLSRSAMGSMAPDACAGQAETAVGPFGGLQRLFPRTRASEGAQEQTFAQGLNYYKLFWIFFIGCFVGVVLESFWTLVMDGRYESRTGLVYGPFNLVYGVGAVVMTAGLTLVTKKNSGWLWTFTAGAVLGETFEYLCSLFQEKTFGTVSWEYSDMALNLNGRINLVYALYWGGLAVLWMKKVYPWLSRQIEKIPRRPGVPLTWALTVFMLFNTVMSAGAVWRMNERRMGEPASSKMELFFDRNFPDDKMERIYPTMQFVEVSGIPDTRPEGEVISVSSSPPESGDATLSSILSSSN